MGSLKTSLEQVRKPIQLVPRSPLVRVSWNLNTLRFGGDYIPQSSSDKGVKLFFLLV